MSANTDPANPIDGRNAFVEDMRIYNEMPSVYVQRITPAEQECALSVEAAPIGVGIKALQLAMGVYKESKEDENVSRR